MMLAIEKFRKKYLLNQKAQGIVEYALILAFVVVVAAAITNGGELRNKVSGVFNSVNSAFGTTSKDATPDSSGTTEKK